MHNPLRLFKSEFVRSIATLTSGNLLALIITVSMTPIVTRIFSPSEFGLFALFMAIVGICSQVGSLCYERAILLPKDEVEAGVVFTLSLLVLFAFVLVVTSLIIFFGTDIATILGNAELTDWAMLIPLGILIVGITNVLRFWAIRQKKFRLISSSRVIEAAVTGSLKILLGFLIGNWSGGLILGTVLGSLVVLLVLLRYLKPDVSILRIRTNSAQNIREVAESFRQFPIYASWNALLTVSSRYLPVFFLSAFFGPAVVGFFNLASRMLTQPISTISRSVSTVYFQKSASQRAAEHQITSGLVKLTLALFAFGFVPFLLSAVFAVEIFSIVFGDQWEVAGYYAQIMTPWFFLLFIRAPANIVFEVCQRQELKLFITFGNSILSIVAMSLLYFHDSKPAAVIGAFVTVNSFMSILQILLAVKVARESDRGSVSSLAG